MWNLIVYKEESGEVISDKIESRVMRRRWLGYQEEEFFGTRRNQEGERGPRPVLLPQLPISRSPPPLPWASFVFLLDPSAVQSSVLFLQSSQIQIARASIRVQWLHLSFLNKPTILIILQTNQFDRKCPIKSFCCSFISKLISKKF